MSKDNVHMDDESTSLAGEVGKGGGALKKLDKKNFRGVVTGLLMLQGVAATSPVLATDKFDQTKKGSVITDGISIQKGEQIEGTDTYKVQSMKKEMMLDNGNGIVVLGANYSSNVGLLANGMIGHMLGKNAAVAIEVEAGSKQARYLATLGYRITKNQRIKLTYEHFEQLLDFTFKSGKESVRMGQESVGASYKIKLDNKLLNYLEARGYYTQAQSKQLEGKDVIIDGATLYEIYRNERRIAGGRKIGGELSLALTPWKDGSIKLSGNYEQVKFDMKNDLTANNDKKQFGGKLELSQKFMEKFEAKSSISTTSTEKYVAGAELSWQALSNLKIYINGQYLERRDGIGGDKKNEYRAGGGLTWAFDNDSLIKQSAKTFEDAKKNRTEEGLRTYLANQVPAEIKYEFNELLLDVAKNPAIRSNTVIVVIDESYKRVLAIDKSALPAGADIDKTNGDINVNVVPFVGINSVTRDGSNYSNNGNFTVSGSRLTIHTRTLQEPAVGVENTYVVTIDEVGGGQTVVNLVIAHGSVLVKSLTVTRISANDINPAVIGDPTAVATNNQVSITNNITDTDGVRNVAYNIYSDAAGTNLIATNGTGVFAGLSALTTYYFKTTAETKNMPANTWTARTSAIKSVTTLANDATTVLSAPTISNITTTTAKATNNITDTDGVRNIAYNIYSDAACTVLVASNTTGDFTGLTASTNYWVKTTAEAKNGTTNVWAPVASAAFNFITATPTDAVTQLSAPILGSKTNLTITILDSTASFTDADGIQNTMIQLATDSSFNTIIQTLPGTTGGTFSGLTGSTTYYARVAGQAKNNSTGLWENKTTPALTVVTSASIITPTAFTFVDVAGVALLTPQISAPITIQGINAPSPISVTGGTYSINGAPFTSVAGVVNNGDQVRVQHTSSNLNLTAVNTTLTVGGVSDTYTTMTVAPADSPTTLAAPVFGSKTGTSITISNSSLSFADADNVRNTSIVIATDAGFSNIIGALPGLTGGTFAGLNGNATYYLRIQGEAFNANSQIWESKVTPALTVTTTNIDNVTTLGLPSVSGISTSGVTVTNGITDLDGIQNITYFIYSDAAGTLQAATPNTTGVFTGLNAGTAYYVKTTAQAKNANTNTWVSQTSGLTSFNTLNADANTVLTTPTVSSFTNRTITVANSVSNFTDTDGIQNTLIQIATDNGFSNVITTLPITGGIANVPTGSTTYYVRVIGQAKNGTTLLWENKSTGFATVTTSADLTTPNSFTFVDVANVALSTLQTSAPITVAGINAPTTITVTGGSYSINGGAPTSSPGTVNNGDQIRAIHISSGTNSTPINTTVTIGGISDTFTTMTVAPTDNATTLAIPVFGSKTDNSITISNSAASFADIDGIQNTSIQIATDSGFSNVIGTIPGVTGGTFGGLTASTTYYVRIVGQAKNLSTTLWENKVSPTLTITTSVAPDTVPDAFTFVDQANVALSTVITSAPITVAGINTASPISVTGGMYSINGGAFTSTPGTVNNGDTVRVQHTSASNYSTAVNTTLTIGGVSDTFTTMTVANSAPTGPALSDVTVGDNLGGAPITPINTSIGVNDANGDTLTYSATGLPSGSAIPLIGALSINPSTGVISGTIDVVGDQTFNITVTVSDGHGGTLVRSFNLTIQDNG